MKKIKYLLLIAFVLVLTGCSADYELTYEDGVFTEDITIYEDKGLENGEILSVTSIQKNDPKIQIDDNNYYEINHSSNNDKNILKLHYKYDDISFSDSKVIKECFQTKTVMDKDKFYSVNLSGDITCEYLEKATITLKSDRKVLDSNATKKDEKNGIYKWDKIPEEGINFLISKELKKEEKISTNKEMIPLPVKIIIAVLVLITAVFAIRYLKTRVNEE